MARDLSLIALLLVLSTAPALAQSKRYPPEPKDTEREAEQHSQFWDSVLDPARKPYDDLTVEGRRRVEEHTKDSAKLALVALDQAVKLLPKEPRAYALRGEAHLVLEHWAACADDLAFADAHAPPGLSPERERQLLELGICQARANRLADAERTLANLVATAPHGDPWMRLGETRIALGKLDEAIDALQAAMTMPDAQRGLTEWFLALAYDRARKPSDPDDRSDRDHDHASAAIRYDVAFNMIENPAYPFLRAGEREYLLALANSAGTMPIPEKSLVYFRQFLKLAPDSPWRRRAEEHVHELGSLEMPQTLQRDTGSSTTIELATLRPTLAKAMPALRACVAKKPTTVWEIAIVRDGPRTPESSRDRPRYTIPKEGATATFRAATDGTSDDAAVKACLEQAAGKIALPAPKDRDTFYRIRFIVVAP